MSCQKEIVKKIRKSKADYLIGLKGNQPALLENAALYFEHYANELPYQITKEKDHGRIEKREYYLLTDLSWLEEQRDWSGLKALGMVKSTITRNDTTSTDTRYFISSLTNLDRFAYAVRKHWAVEIQLHWCLDVIFDEDSCRARKDMSPLNLNVLRKTALALCKHADFGRRISIQKKRFAAALNPDCFLPISRRRIILSRREVPMPRIRRLPPFVTSAVEQEGSGGWQLADMEGESLLLLLSSRRHPYYGEWIS